MYKHVLLLQLLIFFFLCLWYVAIHEYLKGIAHLFPSQMSSKIFYPPYRLVDVLKKNRPEVLKRHAEQLAVLHTALPPEVMQTRFRQNSVLISPKSLHLLVQPEALRRWGIFAVYKPPFCPMKRSEAHHNFHRVSVESFVSAALSSRDVLRHVRGTLKGPMKVRILYSLATECSGPVVISLKDDLPLAHSMRHVHLAYQLLVAGHLPVENASSSIPFDPHLTSALYPSLAPCSTSSARGNTSAFGTYSASFSSFSPSSPSVTYRVARNGYYAHHPVSLVELEIRSPPSASPPSLSAFVAAACRSFIIGDPSGLLQYENEAKEGRREKEGRTGGTGAFGCSRGNSNSFVLRGDCDFPRVFAHLQQVACATGLLSSPTASPGQPSFSGENMGEDSNASQEDLHTIRFQCGNCFEPIFQPKPVYGLKGISMNIRDGSWSPMSEMLP